MPEKHRQLLELLVEQEKLCMQIDRLKDEVYKEMLEQGTTELKTNKGTLKLKKKRGRPINMPNEAVAELEAAIEAEQDEMFETNKRALYELQKTRDLADLQIQKLTTNDWVVELQEKLNEVKKESVRVEGSEQYTLQCKPKQVSPFGYANNSWLLKATKQIKTLPRPMTKSQIGEFLRGFYEYKLYGEQTLDEAWAERVDGHNKYWAERGYN